MDTKKRGIVISNCQCLPIASWLTTLSAHTVYDFWGVHLIHPASRTESIKEFVEKIRGAYDLIISIPLSEDFGMLSLSFIRDTFFPVKIVIISNINFSGFHPDLTYIGGLASRVTGPLGDYHSKLALIGFNQGYSIESTLDLYNAVNYDKMDFFLEYKKSFDELKARDMNVDVPVSSIMPDLLKRYFCMYSINHPTPYLFLRYCEQIMSHLESLDLDARSDIPLNISMCGESLASNVIFPIYPEIASYHEVSHFGSYAFKPVGSRVNAMSLAQFLTSEFSAFNSAGREAICALSLTTNLTQRLLNNIF